MREPQWSINSAVMAKRKRSAIVKDLDFLVSSSNSALIGTKHLSQNRDSEDEVNSWQSLDRDVTDEDTAQRKRRRPAADPSESAELASKIGMSAFVLLAQACKFVPQSFPARQALITNIARAGFKYMQLPVLSAEEISAAIQTITHIYLEGESRPDNLGLFFNAPPDYILWQATQDTGMPHMRFVGPPLSSCINCHSALRANNPPISIVLYTNDGPIPASKIIQKCSNCNLNYHPEMFGNTTDGYRYYDNEQPFVKCTQVAYMERQLAAMISSAG